MAPLIRPPIIGWLDGVVVGLCLRLREIVFVAVGDDSDDVVEDDLVDVECIILV